MPGLAMRTAHFAQAAAVESAVRTTPASKPHRTALSHARCHARPRAVTVVPRRCFRRVVVRRGTPYAANSANHDDDDAAAHVASLCRVDAQKAREMLDIAGRYRVDSSTGRTYRADISLGVSEVLQIEACLKKTVGLSTDGVGKVLSTQRIGIALESCALESCATLAACSYLLDVVGAHAVACCRRTVTYTIIREVVLTDGVRKQITAGCY
jgi:hypothetical protein